MWNYCLYRKKEEEEGKTENATVNSIQSLTKWIRKRRRRRREIDQQGAGDREACLLRRRRDRR